MSKKTSFPKNKIKIFLFEKIHQAAAEAFAEAGYQVELVANAVSGDELKRYAQEAHIIGVRSRTKLRQEQLKDAKRLLAVGCFSVGTDQVSLDAARGIGVPVFNAPHSSTRSVAELTICNILALARRVGTINSGMHQGVWKKSASGSMEVRNKTLGIIGYGHIGQQVGLLAEALGLNVIFYDIVKKLPLGRAISASSQNEVFKQSDFVTLHVPGGEQNEGLIGKAELSEMKAKSYLINLSRGFVVKLNDLAESLKEGRLAGAALDVYPEEPSEAEASFICDVTGLDNVILTPHVGGSTEEAQRNIGREVSESLINFIEHGSTEGAVNFPNVILPTAPNTHRILYIHRNEPGALLEVNNVISNLGVNIEAQYLSTYDDVGYLIMDVNSGISEEVRANISELEKGIKTRILY